MAQRNPIAGLLIGSLTAGIPAIIEAVKAKKEKKAMAAAEAVLKASNSQILGSVIGAAALNTPKTLIPEIPAEIIEAPMWMQGLWIGLAASGIVLRIIGQILKAKAARLPESQQ
jgi:hypothetical protein